jgi:hypothetical protein
LLSHGDLFDIHLHGWDGSWGLGNGVTTECQCGEGANNEAFHGRENVFRNIYCFINKAAISSTFDSQKIAKVRHGLRDTVLERDFGLPSEELASQRDVRLTHFGIILRQVFVHDG